MFNKADVIQSIDEAFLITSVIKTDELNYVLFNFKTQDVTLKKESELHSLFKKVEPNQLNKEDYQCLLNYLNQESKYYSLKYFNYKKQCHHEIINDYESAKCEICEDNLGWFCDESPDQICHYYTNQNGLVELEDNTTVSPPENHNINYETNINK